MANTEQYTHETYLSPFTWRYSSPAMRRIWSELHKRRIWRRLWVALAEAQATVGLVTEAQVADLRKHVDKVNIARAHELEAELRHDLMAEVHAYAEQARTGGSIIHLGATSMDIEDNADALRLRDALDLTIGRTGQLLAALVSQIEKYADLPTMAFTHLQPAEPTTVGYRLAQYAQDIAMDLESLRNARRAIRGKGFSGAVGTSASYAQLLSGLNVTPREIEKRLLDAIDLQPFDVVTQTYPRKQDWLVLNALAGVAGSLYKFAFDLRLLQSPPVGEWAEPFGAKQVGSSAMPFKRNPINAEKIDSLARYVATLPDVAWHNAAHSLLERTLDDSANRRVVLPEAFLAVDEILVVAERLVRELTVHEEAVRRNLATYGPFAATERLLMEAVKAGANRQQFHELIRRHAMTAWSMVTSGQPNPLLSLLLTDPEVTRYVPVDLARGLLDAADYVGDAPERARAFARAATEARWGRTLLVGERLYIARGQHLVATDIPSGNEVVHEHLPVGPIARLILTPDSDGMVLLFEPTPETRGISNILRLDLNGAEEWRAEMTPAVKEFGYRELASDGVTLRAGSPPLEQPVALDWQTGRILA